MLTATVNTSTPAVGGSVIVSYAIKNNGPNAATGATLTVTLPGSGLVTVLGTSYAGPVVATCSGSGPLTCTLPSLASGATETIGVSVMSAVQGSVTINATLSGPDFDSNPANNNASTPVTFTGALNSMLTTLLTDYETSTVQSYSGYPNPAPVCCGQPAQVGANPSHVVIAPNGRLAFVANVNGSYISVVDLTIQAEIARIRDVRAWSLAMTSDGQKLVSVGAIPRRVGRH